MFKVRGPVLFTVKFLFGKDTNRKIRKTEFIYICGSKNGSNSSLENTGEVWDDVTRTQKKLCMSCKEFGTKIQTQYSMKNVVLIFLLVSLIATIIVQVWVCAVLWTFHNLVIFLNHNRRHKTRNSPKEAVTFYVKLSANISQ